MERGPLIKEYGKPVWEEFAGKNGAYVSTSICGKFDAIAEPVENGYLCFIVDVSNGATLKQEFIAK